MSSIEQIETRLKRLKPNAPQGVIEANLKRLNELKAQAGASDPQPEATPGEPWIEPGVLTFHAETTLPEDWQRGVTVYREISPGLWSPVAFHSLAEMERFVKVDPAPIFACKTGE